MSHIIVDIFPSHPPSLFLSPTHTDEQKSFSYSLSLTNTHAHTSIRNHLLRRSFVPKQSIFLLFYPLFVLCSVLPLFVLCFGDTKTAFLYYVNKLLLLQLYNYWFSPDSSSLTDYFTLPHTNSHTQSYTYILALIYTAIKRFS